MEFFRATNKQLSIYAHEGDVEGVRRMIKKGGNANCPSFTWEGDEYLIRSPLERAVLRGHDQVIELLLEHGADIGVRDVDNASLLHGAAKAGHVETAMLLIKRGANVNDQNREGDTPLHYAAKENAIGIIQLLLDNDADATVVNENHQTALDLAASGGLLESVKLLVENGVNIHVFHEHGYSSLTYAIGGSNGDSSEKTALYLLAHGASINPQNDAGQTLLRSAIRNRFQRVTDVLLKRGADPYAVYDHAASIKRENCKDKSGFESNARLEPFTSLAKALSSNNQETVQGFLRQSIVRRSVEEMISRYDDVKKSMEALPDSGWKRTLASVLHNHELDMLYFAFMTENATKREAIFIRVDKSKKWMEKATFTDGLTLMQRAVAFQDMMALERMICHQLDPYESTNDHKLVSETAEREKLRNKIRGRVLETMKHQYADCSQRLVDDSGETSTLEQEKRIQSTLFFCTSVYEIGLAILFAIDLNPTTLKRIIEQGLDMAIHRCFVFEDEDQEFFMDFMSRLLEKNLLSEREKEKFFVRALKVNMENTPWVRDIKASIRKLDERMIATEKGVAALKINFKALETALEDMERREARIEKIGMALTLTCVSLICVGGYAAKEIICHVVLNKGSMTVPEAIKSFLKNINSSKVVNEGLKIALSKALIPVNVFMTKMLKTESELDVDDEKAACVQVDGRKKSNDSLHQNGPLKKSEVGRGNTDRENVDDGTQRSSMVTLALIVVIVAYILYSGGLVRMLSNAS